MSWRRILLLSLLFVAGLGVATWSLLQHTDAATGVVRRELARRIAPPTRLGNTVLDVGLGRLSLADLRIADPTRPDRDLLRVDHADLDVDLDPFGGLLAWHTIALDGFVLDLGPRPPSAAELLKPEAAETTSTAPVRIPPLRLVHGKVRWQATAGAPEFALDDVALELLPVQGSSTMALRGNANSADLGAAVELSGEFAPADGRGRIAAALHGARLDSVMLRRLETQLAIDLRGLEADAECQELGVVWTIAPGEPPLVEVTAELRHVRLAAPRMPRQIRDAAVSLRASTRSGGELRARVLQHGDNGALDASTEITGLATTPSWSVRASGKDLAADADAVDALRLFPLGRDLMAALRPTAGRADVEIFLRDPQRPGGVAEFDLWLRDVAMAYHGFGEGDDQIGFPLPLVGAHGHVRLREDIVLLEDLRAAIDPRVGGGSVQLDGLIETKAPSGEDTTLDIRVPDVGFSPELRDSVAALLHDDGRLYDRLAPSGRAEVEVQVRPRRQLTGGWALTVKPKDGTMSWGGFPYRLEGLGGTVVARRTGVEFDLSGRHGEGRLVLRGHIPLSAESPEGIEGFAAAVELHDVAVDDDLRKALAVCAPRLDAPWRQCAPSGRFGGVVKVQRTGADGPLHHDASLDLAGVTLALPCAPWRAVELGGRLTAVGEGDATEISFDALRGRLDHGDGVAARMAMLGNLHCGAAVEDDLTFVVRGLDLDARLGATLEELGALGPGAWNTLRPAGLVDLVCRHRTGGPEPGLQLVVQLLDVSADAPMLPRPARKVTGELHVADGVLTFDDVRAELGGATVRARSGRISTRPAPDGRTEIAFRAAATGFPVDQGLANLFGGPLRDAIVARALQGRADVDDLELQFLLPGAAGDARFETAISGQLRLYDVAMTLGSGPEGIRVTGLGGVVGLDPCRVSAVGGQLTGILRQGSLRAFGLPLESIEARFVADAERLAMTTLQARLHGGVLRQGTGDAPALHYTLPGGDATEGRLAANLQFEKVDVFAFLRECGWQNPPYSGAASGSLVLERLDGNDVVGASGSGSLVIERGDLGAVPLFTAIYAQLPAPERPRFDHLDARFRLHQRRVEFPELSLRSNLLAANGTGTLDLDGYLDVALKIDNLLGPSADPVFMPLFEYLTQNIVRFHLFGHLRDLHAEKRWVTERSPTRPRVPPMPPFVERPKPPDF